MVFLFGIFNTPSHSIVNRKILEKSLTWYWSENWGSFLPDVNFVNSINLSLSVCQSLATFFGLYVGDILSKDLWQSLQTFRLQCANLRTPSHLIKLGRNCTEQLRVVFFERRTKMNLAMAVELVDWFIFPMRPLIKNRFQNMRWLRKRFPCNFVTVKVRTFFIRV